VFCDSTQLDVLESGLYVGLHCICGPGGVAEVLGCYLTRPEQRLADEELMISHNKLLWDIKRRLDTGHERE
jgi:hypothetical protein